MRYVFEIDLPDGYCLISTLCRHDDTWSVVIRPEYWLRSSYGSSLAANAASGNGTTIAAAVAAAVDKLDRLLEEEKVRSRSPVGKASVSSTPSVEEILAQLGGAGKGLVGMKLK